MQQLLLSPDWLSQTSSSPDKTLRACMLGHPRPYYPARQSDSDYACPSFTGLHVVMNPMLATRNDSPHGSDDDRAAPPIVSQKSDLVRRANIPINPRRVLPRSTSQCTCSPTTSLVQRVTGKRPAQHRTRDGPSHRKATTCCDRNASHECEHLCWNWHQMSTDFERARARHGVDIFYLRSMLALHADQYTAYGQNHDLSGWRSYLDFIPSRYGHDEFLTAAADCVLQQIAYIQGLAIAADTSRQSYTRALHLLQLALNNTSINRQSEVLCAAQLLGAYEYLNPSSSDAWLVHAKGVASLIRHRGPQQSVATEFDKALLAAHVTSALYYAYFMQMPCFLELEDWINACRLVQEAQESCSATRSVIEMQLCAIEMHGQWRKLRLMASSESPDEALAALLCETLRKSYRLHQNTLTGIAGILDHLHAVSGPATTPHMLRWRREAYRYTLQSSIISARLLGTLDLAAYQQLNDDVAAMIKEYLGLEVSSPLDLHIQAKRHELAIQRAFEKDHKIWVVLNQTASPDRRHRALREMYAIWCNTLGPDFQAYFVSKQAD